MNDQARTESPERTDSIAKLWDLIKDIRFAMFTTRDAGGDLHARPMTTQNSRLDEDSNLWFFMSMHGDTVADLIADPLVNVAYADPDEGRYVSVSGSAAVVDDMAKKQQLWSKLAEGWFQGGVNDPDLALVRVKIVQANYWDVRDSKIVQMFKLARAAVTGRPPGRMGEHGEVRMG
jgi:general stress protein 26